jgi:PAS domain S-box-containing protein
MTDRDPLENQRAARHDHTGDVAQVGTRRAGRVDAVVDPVELIDANSDAVLGVDRSGQIRIANAAAGELFGYPVDVLVGGSIERLLPESSRSRHGRLVAHFFDRPVPRRMGGGLPLTARRRTGDVFSADISLAAIESPSHGILCLLIVRDVSDVRRGQLLAAQHLVTRALADGRTLESAAGAVLDVVGPASGAEIAALWVARGSGSVRYVDSWCAVERTRPFQSESVGYVAEPGIGVLGGVVSSGRMQWRSDVVSDPLFDRHDLARRLGVHAGIWVPFADERGRVLGVLELLFGVVRDPDPEMLRILEGFATQLAQYLALRRSENDRQRVLGRSCAASRTNAAESHPSSTTTQCRCSLRA